MSFIFKSVKTLVKVTLIVIGMLAVLKLAYNKLKKRGIIKTEWTVQKPPFGRRKMKYALSVLDKVIVSFQL